MALWIVDTTGDEVFQFEDPTDLTVFTRRNLPSSLAAPQGLSFNAQGHLWIVDNSGDEVFQFEDPTDLTVFTRRNLPSSLAAPQGLSFNAQGHLWIVDFTGSEVFQFEDPTDLTVFTRRNLPSSLTGPTGLSFNAQGHLWIVDNSGDEVFQFEDPTDLTVFTRRNLPSSLTVPTGLSFNAQGHLWIVDNSGNEVFQLEDPTDLTVFTRRNLPSSLTGPRGLSFNDRLGASEQRVRAAGTAAASGSATVRVAGPSSRIRASGAAAASGGARVRTSGPSRIRAAGTAAASGAARVRVTALPSAPDIAIADWDGSGYQAPIVLAVVRATVSGPDITVEPVVVLEGEFVVADDLTVSQVERPSDTTLRFRKTGSGALRTYFGNAGTPLYPDAELFLQTAAGGRARYTAGTSGSNWINWHLVAGEDDDVQGDIVTGDYFLVSVAEPGAEPGVDARARASGTAAASGTARIRIAGDQRVRAVGTAIASGVARIRVAAPAGAGQIVALTGWSAEGWQGAVLVDASFIEGGATAYLRFVRDVGGNAQLRLSATATGEPSDEGPDLTEEVEQYAQAFVFSDDNGSVTLAGPDHPDNGFRDPTDPYFWTPSNSAEWSAWVNAVTGSVTLTISDGDAGVQVQASGTAAASGTARIRVATGRQIRAAGAAAASGAARIRAAGPRRVRASGTAQASGAARVRTAGPARIQASGTAAASGTARVRASITDDQRIRAGGTAQAVGSARIRRTFPGVNVFDPQLSVTTEGTLGARARGARDGIGLDYVWSLDDDASLPAAQYPSNAWGAREGGTAGGRTWVAVKPSATTGMPYVWEAARTTGGFPEVGADVPAEWQTPVLVSQPGEQGEPGIAGLAGGQGIQGTAGIPGIAGVAGIQGIPGLQGLEGLPGPAGLPGLNGQSATRVPTGFPPVKATGGTAWSSFSATVGGVLRGNGNAIANAVAGNDGGPLVGDLVTIFRTSGSDMYSGTRTYTGVGWVDIQSYIHGNLLVSGTIIARHLAAHIITADHILAGSLTAGVVAAGFFDGAINITRIYNGPTVNLGSGSTGVDLTQRMTDFAFLLCFGDSDNDGLVVGHCLIRVPTISNAAGRQRITWVIGPFALPP